MSGPMNEGARHLADYDTGERFTATVVSNQRLTPESSEEDVRELVLDVDQSELSIEVGQNLGVFAPGEPAFGRPGHLRLYSVADLPERGEDGRPRVKICVRRCSYVDDYNGLRYAGIASNYLCDSKPGDVLTLGGPFGLAFPVPAELDAQLILIGSGTGIAPFRAFVKHLHRNVPGWKGKVWLLYGARTGLELVYLNQERDDFAHYYDRDTFEAFKAVSPRPHWADPIAWDYALGSRAAEIWELIEKPKTYVYLAGLERTRAELDQLFTGLAGSKEGWLRRKAELTAGGRWVELLY
jgi:ferredoxin--NADP+ reductase